MADKLQTACGWTVEPPMMRGPLLEGSSCLSHVEKFMADPKAAAPDPAKVQLTAKAYLEQITKISIALDNLEGLTEEERNERRRLFKQFDTVESGLRALST